MVRRTKTFAKQNVNKTLRSEDLESRTSLWKTAARQQARIVSFDPTAVRREPLIACFFGSHGGFQEYAGL